MAPLSADERFMDHALALAEGAAAHGEVPVGAVVVRDGVILGTGENRPIEACDPTAHAEIVALRAAALEVGNYRLAGATLYVTIEPCTMCAGALIHARIARLVYGAPEPRSGAISSASRALATPGLNHHVEVTAGVRGDAAAELLRRFFRARRSASAAVDGATP